MKNYYSFLNLPSGERDEECFFQMAGRKNPGLGQKYSGTAGKNDPVFAMYCFMEKLANEINELDQKAHQLIKDKCSHTALGSRPAHLVAATALFTAPGVPTVFAGDELGATGRNGEHSRTTIPFPPWTRASRKRRCGVFWPDTPWSISRWPSTTAPTIRWTPRKWPSKSRVPWPSRKRRQIGRASCRERV